MYLIYNVTKTLREELIIKEELKSLNYNINDNNNVNSLNNNTNIISLNRLKSINKKQK